MPPSPSCIEASTSQVARAAGAAVTQRAILDAAERLFARRGLDGTRVREIAREAHVNAATLYKFYPGKRALYEAVLERGMRPLIEMLEAYSAGEHGPEPTRALVAKVMDQLLRHPHLSRLIYLEAMSEGDRLPDLAERWFGPLIERILTELRNGPAQSALEPDLQPLAATLFLHLSFGHFALAPLLARILDVDPLSAEGARMQARFIDTLVTQLFPEAAIDVRSGVSERRVPHPSHPSRERSQKK